MKYSLKDLSVATIAAFCIYTAAQKEIGYVAKTKQGSSDRPYYLEIGTYWTKEGCMKAHKAIIGSYLSPRDMPWGEDLVRIPMSDQVAKAAFVGAWVCVPK